MINVVYLHHRKGVGKTVIANMISERSFRLGFSRIYRSCDYEVCICGDAESFLVIEIPEPAVAQRTGKYHFRQPLRQRHHGRKRMGRRATYEDAYLKWLSQSVGFLLVYTYAAMSLVM